MNPVKVGIAGLGTVGSGTVNVLQRNAQEIARRVGRPIDLGLVAKGAGSPASWPEEFRFDGTDAPMLRELDPGHMVRCHA